MREFYSIMNQQPNYDNYEQCFAFYTFRIMDISQAKNRGEVVAAKLKENITNVSHDENLCVLLQSKEWRTRLLDFIVEHKLASGSGG